VGASIASGECQTGEWTYGASVALFGGTLEDYPDEEAEEAVRAVWPAACPIRAL
jgi:hypothetical protein